MKNLKDIIQERLHINKDIKSYNYHPKSRKELKKLVDKLIKDLYSNYLALHQNKKYDDLEESPHGNDLF